MKKRYWQKLLIAAVLALALTWAAMPAMAASYLAMLKSTARVYLPKTPHKCVGKLTKGSRVRVKAVSGRAALISYNGRYLLIQAKYLKKASPRKPGKGTAVVTRCATRVYKKPSAKSGYISVEPGTEMTLLSTTGKVAKVKYKGKLGYTSKDHLRRATSLEPDPIQPVEDIFSGSTEEIIIKFLMRKMGYTRAAACGVVANVWYESGGDTTCVGDYGTSYGIVQWHATRRTNLINWCTKNGYSYSSLKGQLYFLRHELIEDYPTVHNYLKALGNTDKDAYNAAYHFCYYFEAPASRASQSAKRAAYARNTVFLRYA